MSSVENDSLIASKATDAVLLGRIVEQHDTVAMQTLIEKHSTLMMSVCFQNLRNQNDAEDAFQTSIVNFVKDAHKIKQPHYVSTWLYRVAQRESINILRRKKRESVQAIEEQSVVSVDHEVTQEKFEELTSLHEELDQLPEKYRGPLVLCYLEGKSRQEAARELNVTVSSVKASLATGRKQLHKRLLKRGVAMASVLTAWQASQTHAAVTASTALVQQAIQSGVAHSTMTAAATTTGITSLTTSAAGSLGALANKTTWMAVSSGKKMVTGIVGAVLLLGGTAVGTALLLGSTAAILSLLNSQDSTPPVVSEEIEAESLNLEMSEIIGKLKEKEPLYKNLDITMHFRSEPTVRRRNVNNQDDLEQRDLVQHVHQTLRKVTQDSMFRVEFNQEINSSITNHFRDGRSETSEQSKHKHQAEAFDGESSSYVEVTLETPILQFNPNPYQVVSANSSRRLIPFSDLLRGGDYATDLIQAKSKKRASATIRYQSKYLEKTQLAGEPVVVIEFLIYVKQRMIQKDKIYLAINKNYIPMKWEIYSKDDNTLKRYYQVNSWFEQEPGIWFPETAETKTFENEKSRTISYSYEVTTTNPQYPKSFFKVEEPAPSDLQQQ